MHADDTTTVIAEEEVAAVVAVAGPRKLMVSAHCTSSEGVKICVRQGVQVVYHAVHADEEARDMLEAAKDRVFVAPALGLPLTMLREAADYGLKWPAERFANLEKELATTRACMRDLHRRVGKIGNVFAQPRFQPGPVQIVACPDGSDFRQVIAHSRPCSRMRSPYFSCAAASRFERV